MKRYVAIALGALALAACNAEPVGVSNPPTPPTPTEPPTKPDPVNVGMNSGGEVEILPPAIIAEPDRARRRMDLDQLDANIRSVTGGLGWTEGANNQINLFEQLSSTLGKPDYLQVVTEDLTPSAMFQKFLDDAARSVCARLVDEDQTRAEPERVFFKYAEVDTTLADSPQSIQQNLEYLLLRFHGRKLTAQSPEIHQWLWLIKSSEHVAAGDQSVVWRTLCIGLMTHPDFYTY